MHTNNKLILPKFELTTPPVNKVMTLATAKDQIRHRITSTTEDTIINAFIDAATKIYENYTDRQLISATHTAFLDDVPSGRRNIVQLKTPLQSVTTFKYFDVDNAQQTWAATNYEVDTKNEPGLIRTAEDVEYPAVKDKFNTVEIAHVAGYGDDPSDIPDNITTTLKLLLADLYDNRHAQVVALGSGSVAEIPIPKKIIFLMNQDRVVEMM